MCMHGGGPPFGVPIPSEVHEQYSEEVKAAWIKFDEWFKKARAGAGKNPTSKATMPADVRKAFDLICLTPIPGYEEAGITGKDSCYMAVVFENLVD